MRQPCLRSQPCRSPTFIQDLHCISHAFTVSYAALHFSQNTLRLPGHALRPPGLSNNTQQVSHAFIVSHDALPNAVQPYSRNSNGATASGALILLLPGFDKYSIPPYFSHLL